MRVSHKQIVAILPKGKGLDIIRALKEEKQVVSANLNFARGVGRMGPLRSRGLGEQSEKEIVNVIVPADTAEDVYSYIYDAAEIDSPHAGILYMAALGAANHFVLPEDLSEEQ